MVELETDAVCETQFSSSLVYQTQHWSSFRRFLESWRLEELLETVARVGTRAGVLGNISCVHCLGWKTVRCKKVFRGLN